MPTNTTNYGLLLPLVNNATDQDLWGGYLNTDLSNIDSLFLQALNWQTTAKTTAFSVTAPTAASSSVGNTNNLFLCNAAGGGFTASLPQASTCPNGFTIIIKKTDSTANAVTIAANNTDLIDGVSTASLAVQYGWLILVCDGVSNWEIISSTNVGAVKTVKIQTITATGTYTPSAGMLYCTIECVGGGGGGGLSGGGAGLYNKGTFSSAAVGASQAITIGAGGAGVISGAAASAGGVTIVGSLMQASGGLGAQASGSTLSESFANGGLGGEAFSGGSVQIYGQSGGAGMGFNINGNGAGFSGVGGASFFGGAGNGVAGASTSGAVNGVKGGYGSGGSGGIWGGIGGTGGNGFVVITEFCTQ